MSGLVSSLSVSVMSMATSTGVERSLIWWSCIELAPVTLEESVEARESVEGETGVVLVRVVVRGLDC